MPGTDWELWAPPIDPPDDGGLPRAVAQQIADDHANCDPHLIAALQWEAYAGMLPPAPAVASVSTGVQSVSYASGGDGAALALARAAWHRSFLGDGMVSVPLAASPSVRHGEGEPPWPDFF
ncbi:MAG: hypothetical protein FWE35_26480 [Streptosporangiales bacterium]|nr:hypothetical protein [Streptosporangiales bacterium]